MASVTASKPSFTGGEVAEALRARTDLEKYNSFLANCENFVVLPYGGIQNRAGTQFVSATKGNSRVRLIPFQFNVEQSYLMEFGAGYIRFYMDGGVVVYPAGYPNPGAVVEVTTPYQESELADLQYAQSADTVYITHPNYPVRKLKRTSHYDWTLTAVPFGSMLAIPSPTGSGGSFTYSVTAFDTNGETAHSNTVLANNAGTITWSAVPENGGGAVRYRVYRVVGGLHALVAAVDGLSWTVDTSLNVDYDTCAPEAFYDPFLSEGMVPTLTGNTSSGTAAASSVSGAYDAYKAFDKTTGAETSRWLSAVAPTAVAPVTLSYTFASAKEVAGYSVLCDSYSYATRPVSWRFQGLNGATWVTLDTQAADCLIQGVARKFMFGLKAKYSAYRLEILLANASGVVSVTELQLLAPAYPGVVSFFEQRLMFARTNAKPQTFFGSRIGSFENFNKSLPLQDDDAYNFTIASGQVNEIRSMVGMTSLLVFTAGAVWKAAGSNGAITPTSIQLTRATSEGAAKVAPVVVGDEVMYIQGSAAAVKTVGYSLEVDGYRATDISMLAAHLFEGYAITAWSVQRYPYPVVWAVRSDGTLLGLTYSRQHQVTAWHHHVTEGKFVDVCTLQKPNGLDDVYAVVERVVNGTTVRYIELFPERLPDGDIEKAFFVDSGLTYENPLAITAVTKGADTVLTVPGNNFASGDYIDIRGVVSMIQLQSDADGTVLPFKRCLVTAISGSLVTVADADGVSMNSTTWGTYAGEGFAAKAVSTISGLSHLEGKTVTVLANGAVEAARVVTSGAITLTSPASIVHVGLPFSSKARTLELTADVNGVSQDATRTVISATVIMKDTRALLVGNTEADMEEIVTRSTENFDTPTALYTGSYALPLVSGDGKAAEVFITNDQPVPSTVLAIIPKIQVGNI